MAERDGPLGGDGDFGGEGDGAEEIGGADVVVVGEGDEGGEVEVGDLGGFEGEGGGGVEGWGPIAAGVVGMDAGEADAAALEETHDGLEEGPVGGKLGEEVEGFAGLVGVGVEGDAGGEGVGGFRLAPEEGGAGEAHGEGPRFGVRIRGECGDGV